MADLTAKKMREALKALDALLPKKLEIIIGGGGAMLLAHDFPLTTTDIDAVPRGMSTEELTPFIEKVAAELGLTHDWLNPWYGSFTYVLPADFADRLHDAFTGRNLHARALGKEDLLLMKCFAHRPKDISHARALVRGGADVNRVQEWIEEKRKKKIPQAEKAANFLADVLDMEGL